MANNTAPRTRRADFTPEDHRFATGVVPPKKPKIGNSPATEFEDRALAFDNSCSNFTSGKFVLQPSEILPSCAEPSVAEESQVFLTDRNNLNHAAENVVQKHKEKVVQVPQTPNSPEEQRSQKLQTNLEELEGSGPSVVQTSLMGEHAIYKDLSLIGDGAYGTVYKAKDATNGQVVALKKVRVPVTEDGLPSSTLREIAALKQLDRFDHPQIVKLLDVCQGNYFKESEQDVHFEGNQQSRATHKYEELNKRDLRLTLWLVFEHIDYDLATFMADYKTRVIEPKFVCRISKEIILGVDFLHSHRIIHRDLKPQNILINRNGNIKIADFGLAKTYDFEMRLTSVVVTLWYRAPEVLLGLPYATPIDIWAIGCILAELNRLSPLFPGTSEGDQLDKIFKIIGTPSEKDWPEKVPLTWSAFPFRHPVPLQFVIPNISNTGISLIRNMLLYSPHDRVTAAQALKHPYFSENI